MKNMIKAGSVALGLGFAAAVSTAASPALADQHHAEAGQAEFNARFSLPNPTGGAPTDIVVPIDCDLLGQDGAKTLDFIRQFDIWGHLAHERDIARAELHLRSHGITPERVERVRQHCVNEFLS